MCQYIPILLIAAMVVSWYMYRIIVESIAIVGGHEIVSVIAFVICHLTIILFYQACYKRKSSLTACQEVTLKVNVCVCCICLGYITVDQCRKCPSSVTRGRLTAAILNVVRYFIPYRKCKSSITLLKSYDDRL